jgi:hypothetical protein
MGGVYLEVQGSRGRGKERKVRRRKEGREDRKKKMEKRKESEVIEG